MASQYWIDRNAKAQKNLTTKNINQTNEQLRKYYATCMKNVIAEFEATYDKLLAAIEKGKEPTPADLYKLDKYWQMQVQLQEELKKLGDKQAALLGRKFSEEYKGIYETTAIAGDKAFSTIDKSAVSQMINQVWCADGKSWSQRIWENTNKLQQTLNDNLINCVVTGKKTTELKKKLQEDFNVSYGRANTLVRTEMARLHVDAAKKRYSDYGIKQVEILVDEDERTCPVCSKLEGKKYGVHENLPVPAHPRCRCAVIPVVDEDVKEDETDKNTQHCPLCNKEFTPKDGYMVCDECQKKILNDSWSKSMVKSGYNKKDIVNIEVDESVWDKMISINLFKTYMEQNHNFMSYRDENNKYVRAAKVPDILNNLVKEWRTATNSWRQREIETEIEKYLFVCVDCGKVVVKKSTKSNAQNRCPECQAKYRKKYKAKKEAERRARNKKK